MKFRMWVHQQVRTRCGWGTMLVLAFGCSGGGPGTEPDAMSAEAHRQKAVEEAREGQAHQQRYDSWARGSHEGQRRDPDQLEPYNPAAVQRRLAREHEKHAREHLEAARILEAFAEAECGEFPPQDRVVCPLIGQIDAFEDVSSGVRIRLAEGVDVDAAISHMHCHLAFARTHGRVGMDECPLYLRGIRVERVARSRSIDLIPANPDDLEALRLRTSLHVEE